MSDMTTTPDTPAEIDAVFGDGIAASFPQPSSAREEWRAFGTFLKNPTLPDHKKRMGSGARAILRMLGLDLIFLLIFIAALMTLVAIGIKLPENLNSSLEMSIGTVVLVVIAAPLIEELIFRSWLSGRPRYLIVLPILFVAGTVAAVMGVSKTGEEAELGVGLSLLGGALFAAIATAVVWKRPTPQWFKTIFPGAFWLSSIAFALVHFANYTEGSILVLLPLVLPQFVLGSIAAYLRVHYGLWTAVALHAVHNGIAIGVAFLAMASEGSA
ncbi:CPBP family intramembrane glutamic endopeptidase [Erythrobacter crassostreae]|uniref:CPBP family intramembrane metalloprotease n=1 Tax=Erythrobacter crassostreae TaxID=2828328 RepID=A0A9X1F1B9_9SPHN|nr:CPBP family intramembrane glutamic endopeptidase [Erythrobacter crassostrea]MBV7258314.1 CPBP family intramembrane metalloprotease [Erythrobacter crassostrea]